MFLREAHVIAQSDNALHMTGTLKTAEHPRASAIPRRHSAMPVGWGIGPVICRMGHWSVMPVGWVIRPIC